MSATKFEELDEACSNTLQCSSISVQFSMKPTVTLFSTVQYQSISHSHTIFTYFFLIVNPNVRACRMNGLQLGLEEIGVQF